ncbi:potassium voltage-gated channel subfamily E member 4 [Stigmatopora argus]
MEHLGNSNQTSTHSPLALSGRNAYLYILIAISFYGVFLCGIMLCYFHSKRKEKRRTNIFTRLVHEEEQREWGSLPKKHSFSLGAEAAEGMRSLNLALPFCASHGNPFGRVRHEGALPSPLACVLCAEQSSVSSLCSSADTRLAIEEEESDSGTGEGPDESNKGPVENVVKDSG